MVWEQIVQIIQRITWVSPPSISAEWKRKVAQDAIESLSASKLAKSICSQFCKKLKNSHEAFAASLKQVSVSTAPSPSSRVIEIDTAPEHQTGWWDSGCAG
ncbi:hypothetical protein FKM82_029581 [Ascaphus truei]